MKWYLWWRSFSKHFNITNLEFYQWRIARNNKTITTLKNRFYRKASLINCNRYHGLSSNSPKRKAITEEWLWKSFLSLKAAIVIILFIFSDYLWFSVLRNFSNSTGISDGFNEIDLIMHYQQRFKCNDICIVTNIHVPAKTSFSKFTVVIPTAALAFESTQQPRSLIKEFKIWISKNIIWTI